MEIKCVLSPVVLSRQQREVFLFSPVFPRGGEKRLVHFCLTKSKAQCLASSSCSLLFVGRKSKSLRSTLAAACASSQYLLSKAPRCLCCLSPKTFVKLPSCRWLPTSFVLFPPASLPPSPPSGSLGTFLWEESARERIPYWYVKQDGRDCSAVTLSWQGFPLCTRLGFSCLVTEGVSAICSSPRGTGPRALGRSWAWRREGILGGEVWDAVWGSAL